MLCDFVVWCAVFEEGFLCGIPSWPLTVNEWQQLSWRTSSAACSACERVSEGGREREIQENLQADQSLWAQSELTAVLSFSVTSLFLVSLPWNCGSFYQQLTLRISSLAEIFAAVS